MQDKSKRNTKLMSTSVPLSWKIIETLLIMTHNLNLSNALGIIVLFDVHNNSVNSYEGLSQKTKRTSHGPKARKWGTNWIRGLAPCSRDMGFFAQQNLKSSRKTNKKKKKTTQTRTIR